MRRLHHIHSTIDRWLAFTLAIIFFHSFVQTGV